MRIYVLSFLLVVAALGIESANGEEEEELYIFDDFGNPVRLEYNESDASIPSWPADRDVSKDVKFYLYPRPQVETELFIDDIDRLKESGFDTNQKTVFVTHGWMNSKDGDSCKLVRDALLQRDERINVIVVDWSRISKSLVYPIAARGVPNVGKFVAKMINFLYSQNTNLDKMTLVGHSLGAHVMGIAGHNTVRLVNFIYGLDPALPLFSSKQPGERISSGDAGNVEIIHTNAGRLGFASRIGQADFYPNGGRTQPDCGLNFLYACSHARSYKYFAESLVTEVGFWGRRCSGTEILPEKCNGEFGLMGDLKSYLPVKGGFYLRTNGVPPYAQGR